MNKSKLQILYIIGVLLLLIFISNMSYNNIKEPIVLVPFIVVSLIIGVTGAYLFGTDMRLYKNVYFISYIITIGLAFVPILGVYHEDGNFHYGFPAQWFSYYSHLDVSIHLLGFLFNYFIIYLILRFLTNKILRSPNDD